MRWFHWVLLAAIVTYLADLACGVFLDWQKRRDAHIKAALLNRYNLAAFRGARKFDDPRWKT